MGKLTPYSCLTIDLHSAACAAAAAPAAAAPAPAACAAAAPNRKKSNFENNLEGQCSPISPHIGITSEFWARRDEAFTDNQPKPKRVYYPD